MCFNVLNEVEVFLAPACNVLNEGEVFNVLNDLIVTSSTAWGDGP